jgi:prophage antirepressor-like protein
MEGKELMVFTNKEFGQVRIFVTNDGLFNLNLHDVCFALGYTKEAKGKLYLRKDLIENICETLDITGLSLTDNYFKITKDINFEETYITEEAFYDLCLESHAKNARGFRKWVTHEVLPTIRKTGGYVANEDLFVNTYLPFADDATKTLFKSTLTVIRNQNAVIQKQQKELEYKEDVIIGLVDKISLAEKRQILNRVVRKVKNYQERWNELYRQFEMKFHVDLDRRLAAYNQNNKPKLKNKLDYIDKVLNKIPEIYEIACKLYESDVKELVQELYELRAVGM